MSLIVNEGLKVITAAVLEKQSSIIYGSVLGQRYWHPVTHFLWITGSQPYGLAVVYEGRVETQGPIKVVGISFVFEPLLTNELFQLRCVGVECEGQRAVLLAEPQFRADSQLIGWRLLPGPTSQAA